MGPGRQRQWILSKILQKIHTNGHDTVGASYCYRYPQKFQPRKKVVSNSIQQVASYGLQDISVNVQISKFHNTIMHNHLILWHHLHVR